MRGLSKLHFKRYTSIIHILVRFLFHKTMREQKIRLREQKIILCKTAKEIQDQITLKV